MTSPRFTGTSNDNWRIRRNLTLNLGLRYEYTTIPYTQRLAESRTTAASVPGLINFSSPQAARTTGRRASALRIRRATAASTSIRGGAGIAYDVLFDNLGLLSLPPQLSSTIDCAPVGNYDCPNPGSLRSGGILAGARAASQPSRRFADQRAATSAFVPVNQKVAEVDRLDLGHSAHFPESTSPLKFATSGLAAFTCQRRFSLNKQPVVTPTNFLPTYTTAPSQATLDASTLDLATLLKAESAHGSGVRSSGLRRSNITSYQPWASSTYHGLAGPSEQAVQPRPAICRRLYL